MQELKWWKVLAQFSPLLHGTGGLDPNVIIKRQESNNIQWTKIKNLAFIDNKMQDFMASVWIAVHFFSHLLVLNQI